MKRHLVVVSTITAVALIGGGAALAFGTGSEDSAPVKSPAAMQGNDRDTDAQDDRDDRAADAAEGRSSKLTVAQAIDAALKAKPGTAVSADLDAGGDDIRGWEVDILGSGSTSYTVHVDDRTGKILAVETERDDDAADAHPALKIATVDAKEAAEAAAPKGTVTSVDLDDDRSPRWDVETTDTHGMEHDWNVDAKTAEITPDRDND